MCGRAQQTEVTRAAEIRDAHKLGLAPLVSRRLVAQSVPGRRIGLKLRRPSCTIDATVDDPTRTYPNPLLNSSPTGRTVTVFNSSQLCGSTQSGGSSGGVTARAFSITQPIAAWRLTLNNSSLGSIVATVIQPGPRYAEGD
jgi:hypothetical protein